MSVLTRWRGKLAARTALLKTARARLAKERAWARVGSQAQTQVCEGPRGPRLRTAQARSQARGPGLRSPASRCAPRPDSASREGVQGGRRPGRCYGVGREQLRRHGPEDHPGQRRRWPGGLVWRLPGLRLPARRVQGRSAPLGVGVLSRAHRGPPQGHQAIAWRFGAFHVRSRWQGSSRTTATAPSRLSKATPGPPARSRTRAQGEPACIRKVRAKSLVQDYLRVER